MDPKMLPVEWLFVAASKMHKNLVANEMIQSGMGQFGQPFLLSVLADQNEPMPQKELAAMLGVSPAAVTVSLQRMVKSGLVKKNTDDADQRRNTVSITEEGRAFMQHCDVLLSGVDESTFVGFSSEDKAQFSVYLRRMIENISQKGVSEPQMPRAFKNRTKQ